MTTRPAASRIRGKSTTSRANHFHEILLLEDNSTTAKRRRLAGVGSEDTGQTITVRVHRLNGASKLVAARRTYEAGGLRSKRSARIELATKLVDRAANGALPVVVAGASYGSAYSFLEMLSARDLPFVVQIRPSTVIRLNERRSPSVAAAEVLERGTWRDISTVMPDGLALECSAAKLGTVALPSGSGRLFAAQVGGIQGVHRGTIIGIASFDASLADLVQLIAHARWIRRISRRSEKRGSAASAGAESSGAASAIAARPNIALARRQDARADGDPYHVYTPARGLLRHSASTLNVIELFSGAGGMGLGFLLSGGAQGRYRIVYSGEASPIFVQTLRANHASFERAACLGSASRTPELVEPVDLRKRSVLDHAESVVRKAGGAHVLIGGPPCQGFSMANRNSWSANNPHNELIDVFTRYVLRLRPLAFLMENVQGILWTANARASASVVDVIERRLKAAGYMLFPKLLDAAWYGAPQNRTRFFLMGLHRDLGYSADDFGSWGPFPKPSHGSQMRPFVTVRQAIADLPRIENGESKEFALYAEPSEEALQKNEFLQYARAGAEPGTISDHVTSRHADYVVARYRSIPAGGNWESIRDQMTNYADVSRTHSNIYRRLQWDEPSVTIGHYRKSMLVHPNQHRGLSLREASRLQSFPDWFRFAGTANGQSGGLVHKQQQLANAVCPLVTRAIAEFLSNL